MKTVIWITYYITNCHDCQGNIHILGHRECTLEQRAYNWNLGCLFGDANEPTEYSAKLLCFGEKLGSSPMIITHSRPPNTFATRQPHIAQFPRGDFFVTMSCSVLFVSLCIRERGGRTASAIYPIHSFALEAFTELNAEAFLADLSLKEKITKYIQHETRVLSFNHFCHRKQT